MPSRLLRGVRRLALIFCGAFTFRQYIGKPWMLSETSMEPTFKEGQIVFCSPWPWCGKVEVGDVVIAKHPSDPNVKICKRVKGVSGDVVVLPPFGTTSVLVPPGHVWLEGNNDGSFEDPATPVPIGLLEGKVSLSLRPFITAKAWKAS